MEKRWRCLDNDGQGWVDQTFPQTPASPKLDRHSYSKPWPQPPESQRGGTASILHRNNLLYLYTYRLQALVYDIRPPTTAKTGYIHRSRKTVSQRTVFHWCSNSIPGVSFITAHASYASTNKPQIVWPETDRAQELCESRGRRLGLPSLISLTVFVDVKQHFNNNIETELFLLLLLFKPGTLWCFDPQSCYYPNLPEGAIFSGASERDKATSSHCH